MAFEITNLVEKIRHANDAYREGEPVMSDAEYDALLDELKELDPGNVLLKRGIIEEAKGKARMEKLPVPMYSLEKVKTWDEIRDWLGQFTPDTRLVMTPKYDGISLVTSVGDNVKAWTRGDGVEGQASHRRFREMKGYPNYYLVNFCDYCWGEAIMRKDKFKKWMDAGYKTARNMVAGQFNADDWNPEILADTDYVIYGCDASMNKTWILRELERSGAGGVYTVMRVRDVLESEGIFNELFTDWSEYYCIDGIVMELDDHDMREALGRLPNGNPRYAMAVKFPEWNDAKVARVEGVTWKISKDGVSRPVIQIEPTEIGGVTVCNVTGHNAAYVIDNKLHKGALIRVRRSGDVIPKHDETVDWNEADYEKWADEIMLCPSCGSLLRWNETYVDLLCMNPSCRERVIAQNLFFFTTMGIEEVGEPTVMKLYDAGYDDVAKIVKMTEEEWCRIPGLGTAAYRSLMTQLDTMYHSRIPLARLMTAFNTFGGVFGEKTCQMIFDELGLDSLDTLLDKVGDPDFYNELVGVRGVGETVAKFFIHGVRQWAGIDNLKTTTLDIYLAERKKSADGKSVVVCFSGVRDKKLEKELTDKGHRVASGVSRNTDLLVVKDVEGSSSKIKKARDLGIPVVAIDDRDLLWKTIEEL